MQDSFGNPVNGRFNEARNFSKAFDNLLGIVNGIQADTTLTDNEVYFLGTWLRSNEHLAKDPDVYDLFDAIDSVIEDGVITEDEKEDLSILLSDFIDYRDEYNHLNVDVDEVIKRSTGVFSGIAADGVVSSDEVLFLKEYLEGLGDLKEHWPLSAVSRAVDSVLADGYISGAEKEFMLSVLNDSTGGAFTEDGIASGKTTMLPLDDVAQIDFDGKVFCFTGALSWGSRKQCCVEVESRGGVVAKGVTRKLDYLIVGPAASRDWFNTSYGRKIEKAVSYRDDAGIDLKIISEDVWVSSF